MFELQAAHHEDESTVLATPDETVAPRKSSTAKGAKKDRKSSGAPSTTKKKPKPARSPKQLRPETPDAESSSDRRSAHSSDASANSRSERDQENVAHVVEHNVKRLLAARHGNDMEEVLDLVSLLRETDDTDDAKSANQLNSPKQPSEATHSPKKHPRKQKSKKKQKHSKKSHSAPEKGTSDEESASSSPENSSFVSSSSSSVSSSSTATTSASASASSTIASSAATVVPSVSLDSVVVCSDASVNAAAEQSIGSIGLRKESMFLSPRAQRVRLLSSSMMVALVPPPDGSSPIELLSDALLIHIFSYLAPSDICFGCMLVCLRWSELGRQPSPLWWHLDLKNHWRRICQTDQKVMAEFLSQRRFRSVVSMHLGNLAWREKRLYQTLQRFSSNLRALSFEDCPKLKDAHLQCLMTIPNLRYLNLSGCKNISDKGLKHLRRHKFLRSLVLAACDGISLSTKNVLSFMPSPIVWDANAPEEVYASLRKACPDAHSPQFARRHADDPLGCGSLSVSGSGSGSGSGFGSGSGSGSRSSFVLARTNKLSRHAGGVEGSSACLTTTCLRDLALEEPLLLLGFRCDWTGSGLLLFLSRHACRTRGSLLGALHAIFDEQCWDLGLGR